jgi:hypothetical protein
VAEFRTVAEQTIIAEGVVGCLHAVTVHTRIVGADDAVVAIGSSKALHTDVIRLIAQSPRTRIAAPDADAATADIDGSAEQDVVTGSDIVGKQAGVEKAPVGGTYVAVVTMCIGFALHTRAK